MNATLEEKLDRPLLFPGLTWKQFKTLELTSCTIVKNRQDACSTIKFISCGTGILPVPKQVIENGARYQLEPMLDIPCVRLSFLDKVFEIQNCYRNWILLCLLGA